MQDTPKNLDQKREDEKRRFSQEKDNKRSKKDHIYEDEDALKNKPGRFIKPEKKKEEVQEEQIKVINHRLTDLEDYHK